jgi:hypothetical protein
MCPRQPDLHSNRERSGLHRVLAQDDTRSYAPPPPAAPIQTQVPEKDEESPLLGCPSASWLGVTRQNPSVLLQRSVVVLTGLRWVSRRKPSVPI